MGWKGVIWDGMCGTDKPSLCQHHFDIPRQAMGRAGMFRTASELRADLDHVPGTFGWRGPEFFPALMQARPIASRGTLRCCWRPASLSHTFPSHPTAPHPTSCIHVKPDLMHAVQPAADIGLARQLDMGVQGGLGRDGMERCGMGWDA
jgi:hypothetical protein